MLEINTELNEETAEKLAYIQTATQEDDKTVILSLQGIQKNYQNLFSN